MMTIQISTPKIIYTYCINIYIYYELNIYEKNKKDTFVYEEDWL